jgi:hypothetical protein
MLAGGGCAVHPGAVYAHRLALWVMDAFNIPPVRARTRTWTCWRGDQQPIRMLAVSSSPTPPSRLVFAPQLLDDRVLFHGAQTLRRVPEHQRSTARLHRKSFAYFNRSPVRCRDVLRFAAMLFFGAFCMRHRLEPILAFPAIALVMAVYLSVAMKENSARRIQSGQVASTMAVVRHRS